VWLILRQGENTRAADQLGAVVHQYAVEDQR
jgi:hypothetical protein